MIGDACGELTAILVTGKIASFDAEGERCGDGVRVFLIPPLRFFLGSCSHNLALSAFIIFRKEFCQSL